MGNTQKPNNKNILLYKKSPPSPVLSPRFAQADNRQSTTYNYNYRDPQANPGFMNTQSSFELNNPAQSQPLFQQPPPPAPTQQPQMATTQSFFQQPGLQLPPIQTVSYQQQPPPLPQQQICHQDKHHLLCQILNVKHRLEILKDKTIHY